MLQQATPYVYIMYLIKATNLSIKYNELEILQSFSLEINAGDIIGISGPSGIGKSSLLNAFAGLLPASARLSGSILWQGQELIGNRKFHQSLQGRSIGLLPQQPVASLFPLATIGEQIWHIQKTRGAKDKQAAKLQAAATLTNLQFEDPQRILAAYPCQLSGGQAQRICLAMSLLQKPQLLLADEPTSSLDADAQEDVLNQLQLFHEALPDSALLIVSHNKEWLERISTRIVRIGAKPS